VTREWSLATAHDVVSAAIPERDMVFWGDVRRTYGEIAKRSRSARLARSKAPRAFVFVALVERPPSSKANYQWARVIGERATEAF
jgi:hypothetical protein